MLCQLCDQIHKLQKDRDVAIDRSAVRNTVEFIKRKDEHTVENTRQAFSLPKTPRSPNDEVPHRNELPPREPLPYREFEPKPLTPEQRFQANKKFFDALAALHLGSTKTNTDALPARKQLAAVDRSNHGESTQAIAE